MTATTSPADTLQAASERLREAAGAATAPHWSVHACCPNQVHYEITDGAGLVIADAPTEADATYIATVSPPFALAVAEWLSNQADTTCDCGVDESALAVARAVLGELPGVGAR